MIKQVYITGLLLPVILSLTAGNYLNAQTPTPPPGKVWVLNREMSDEFGPGGPGDIWDVYDKADSWDRTAAFDRRVQEIQPVEENGEVNYVLAMNPMWYDEEDIFTKNGRTYYFAGGGMRTKANTTYGYMEVRIKPSDFPMGSGVFMFSRDYTPGECGEVYHTELDIIENMSYTGPGASDHWNGYQHVNTHVWPTDENCNRLSSTQYGGSKEPLEGPLDFNVVGAWWVDKDSVQFYLNGRHWHTVEFLKDSYMPMPLILTMETYTWGSDENNADNPKPEEYMFRDDFRSREERAVYYDWVRTWNLADIDSNLFNPDTVNIMFLEDPMELYEDSTMEITVIYSATDTSLVTLSILDPQENLIGADTISVTSGVQSELMRVESDTLITAGDYVVVCQVLPVDQGGQVTASDTANLTVLVKPVEARLFTDGFPSQVYPSGSGYLVDVHYQGASNMEVAVELRDPAGNWIGGGLVAVPDGSGVVEVPVNLIAATEVGTGYYWKTHIRPRGTTWRESIFAFSFIPFQVIREPKNEVSLTSEGWPLPDTVSGFNVEIAFESVEDADLKVSFSDGDGIIIADSVFAAASGQGTTDVYLLFHSIPSPADNYVLTGNLYLAGTDSLLAGDTISGLEIVEVPDTTVSFSSGRRVLNRLNVIPNPSTGKIRLAFSGPHTEVDYISISEITGRVVWMNESVPATNERTGPIDLSALQSGIYFIRVETTMDRYISRFVLEK